MASNDGLPMAWGPKGSTPPATFGQPPASPGASDWMAYAAFGLGVASCAFSCLTGVPAIALGLAALSRVQSGAKVFAVLGVALGGLTTLAMFVLMGLMLVGAASMATLQDEVGAQFPTDEVGDFGDEDDEGEEDWTDE